MSQSLSVQLRNRAEGDDLNNADEQLLRDAADVLDQAEQALSTMYVPNGDLYCRWCGQQWTQDGHADNCGCVELNDMREAALTSLRGGEAPKPMLKSYARCVRRE